MINAILEYLEKLLNKFVKGLNFFSQFVKKK